MPIAFIMSLTLASGCFLLSTSRVSFAKSKYADSGFFGMPSFARLTTGSWAASSSPSPAWSFYCYRVSTSALKRSRSWLLASTKGTLSVSLMFCQASPRIFIISAKPLPYPLAPDVNSGRFSFTNRMYGESTFLGLVGSRCCFLRRNLRVGAGAITAEGGKAAISAHCF